MNLNSINQGTKHISKTKKPKSNISSKKLSYGKLNTLLDKKSGTPALNKLMQTLIFTLADKTLEGFYWFSWVGRQLDNGGIYLVPSIDQVITAKTSRGLSEVSADAFGLAMTICAYSHLSNLNIPIISPFCLEQNFKLQQYNRQHPEYLEIHNILD